MDVEPAGAAHHSAEDLTDGERLQLREAQLRGIVDSASEGILTVDESQTIVMANRMAGEMFRYSVTSLLGLPLERLLPERFRPRHADLLRGHLAGESPARRMSLRREVTGLRADGTEFPMEVGISLAHVDGVRLSTAILRDLSETRRTATALRSSEQLLAATFNIDAVGMAHVDPATRRLLAVNAAFCSICGHDEATLLGMSLDQIVHPDDRHAAVAFGALLASGVAGQREKRVVRRDGTTIWVQIAGGVVRDENGAPLRIVCVVQDITARREAESTLRTRAARQSFLVRLNDRLRQLDEPLEIRREAARLLGEFLGAQRVGYAEDDGDGASITVVGHYTCGVPGIEGRYRYVDFGASLMEQLCAGGTVVRGDIARDPTLSVDEKAAHAALQLAATVNVPLTKGGRLGALLFVHASAPRDWRADDVALIEEVAERIRADIERARAETALRAGKATLEAALASMNDAVAISDAEGRFVDINAAFATFHRFRGKAECLRAVADYEAIMDVTLPDGTPAPMDQWAVPRALRGEASSNVEYGLRLKSTGERWVGSFSFAPIRDGAGRIVGAVITGRDITEIRRIRSELEASHTELQRLIVAQDTVQERERLRIAGELHDDLQQNLAAILMETEVVRTALRGIDGRVAAALDRIEQLGIDVIASMRRIIQDLRPQALEELGLVAALQTLGASFAGRTGIHCSVDASALRPEDLPRLAPVATCLYRVAQESLNNVARHAGAHRVDIRLAAREDGRLSLCVADDGRGFVPQERARPGAFGLPGMRERLRVFGGSLSVHSEPGHGTQVEAMLPPPPPAH